MIFTLFTLIILIAFSQSILACVHIVKIHRVFSRYFYNLDKSSFSKDLLPNLVVVIPVLGEAKVLREALLNFSRLQYPPEKLKIVVVTTEKEFEHDCVSPNSIEVVREEIPRINKNLGREIFLHIHYPLNDGVKSDQLNYAITQLNHLYPTFFDEKTYIGIYDIDSLVPQNTLILLARDSIQNNFPNIYQQPTLYFKNFAALGNHVDGFLSRSFAFLQTTYAISYEAYNLFKQSEILKKNLPFFSYKMRYCIGHGLFIRWPYLKRLGFFPTPIEDTRLGHIVSYLKEDIRLLPIFDTVGIAKGVRESIKQASTWFLGEALFIEDLRIARKIKPVNNLYGFWLSFYKGYRNAVWILKGPILSLLILWSIVTRQFLLIALILLSVYLPIICFSSKIKSWEKFSAGHFYKFKIKNLVLVLFIPLEAFLMSIGPLIGFFKFCIWRITAKKPTLYRTEK